MISIKTSHIIKYIAAGDPCIGHKYILGIDEIPFIKSFFYVSKVYITHSHPKMVNV